MRLSDLLSRDRIGTGLDVSDKSEALAALARLLARGLDGQNAMSILRVLEAREAQQSTGVGDEVAIPHGRLAGLSQLIAAIAIVPAGVEFEAIDHRPVRILVAILAPEGSVVDHLRALARVARLLRDARIRQRILEASGPDEVFRAVADEESTLLP
jgi:PTS system nitrogen regulatory IIA component